LHAVDNDIAFNQLSGSAIQARIVYKDGHWRVLNPLATDLDFGHF